MPIHHIVIRYPQQMVQMAFCDLSHTFHKQVTNVSQHVFVILLCGILMPPLILSTISHRLHSLPPHLSASLPNDYLPNKFLSYLLFSEEISFNLVCPIVSQFKSITLFDMFGDKPTAVELANYTLDKLSRYINYGSKLLFSIDGEINSW